MMQPAMPSIGWLKHAFGRQRRLSLNPLHPSVKVSTAFLGHGGRLKRPFFASVAIITTWRNRNFARAARSSGVSCFSLSRSSRFSSVPWPMGSCPVVLHGLLEASAVDNDHSGDVDFFRFYVPEQVQAPLFITCRVTCQLRSVAATDWPTI